MQYTCTLAEVSLVQGCSNGGSALNWMNIDQATLAGTFTLTRQDIAGDPLGLLPGECVWFYGETPGTTITAQAYQNGGNCVDNHTGDFGFYIRLSRTVGSPTGRFRLEAWLGSASAIFHDLFLAAFDTPDCDSSATASAGDGGVAYGSFAKGTGGSAVITPG